MNDEVNDPDLLEEYDFSNGERGIFYEKYQEGQFIILVEPNED